MYPYYNQPEAAGRGPLLTSPLAATSPQNKRTHMSTPGESPGSSASKVPKVSRACDYCKSKKTKCSGTRPCGSCVKRGIACHYDAKYSRGRPPTPPVGPTAVEGGTHTDDDRDVEMGISAHVTGPDTTGRPHGYRSRPSVFPTDDMPPSRASPDLDVAEIEGQYFDTTSGLTFLHRAYKKLSTQNNDIAPHIPNASAEDQRLVTVGDRPFKIGTEALNIPVREDALQLMRFYFDTCVVTYRIFHRQTVFGWLKRLLSNFEEGLPLTNELGHAKAAVVLAILAVVTFRREKIQRVASQGCDEDALVQSDPFFSAAVDLTDAETGFPRLESTQARLMQVLYLLQTSRMNQGWYVFGRTTQITSAQGLHRRTGRKRNGMSKSGVDYISLQCERRTFWVAYMIDKYLSVVFGRPRHYHDEDIDQELPDCINDEDMTPQGPSSAEPKEDCYVDAVIFHTRLAQIIGITSRDVYTVKNVPKQERMAAAHRAVRELQRWRESLPPYLGTIRPSTLVPAFRRQATALRLAYSHAIIHANRPFLLGHLSNGSGGSTRSSVAECISAARVILETVDGMADEGTLVHAFWWTPYVTFCALAVVYVREIQQSAEGDARSEASWAEVVDLADKCLSHLAKSTSADSPNRRYSVILEELRLEARHQASQCIHRQNDEGRVRAEADGVLGVPLDSQQQLHGTDQSYAGGGIPGQDGDGSLLAMSSLLSGWQTSDWLDLDASVSLQGHLRVQTGVLT